MPLIKGLDFPVRDALADLPSAAVAGICMVSDPRGIPDAVSGKRYAYQVRRDPAGGNNPLQLWRYDLESRAAFRMADLPAPAAGAFVFEVCAACYVPFGGPGEDQPFVYVIVGLTAAPWNQLMGYNVHGNVWGAPLLAIPGLAAALPTSIAITNTSGAMGDFFPLNANIRNRFLYISGGGGTLGGAGVSNVDQYNMVTNAHVLLTGAGGARAAAPAAGSKLVWLPNYPDRLYSNRGGVSTILDYYSFSTDTWTPNTPPQGVVMGEGTEFATLYSAPGWMAVRPGAPGNEILAIEGGGLNFQTICNISDSVLPAAHASNALIAWWIAGGYYFGVVPYGTSQFKRIQIPMPL